MNRTVAVLFLVIVLAAANLAQAQEAQLPPQLEQMISRAKLEELRHQAAKAQQAFEELVNLERETARALQLRNGAFFRRVYSDEFVGTDLYGQVLDKPKLLASVETSNVRYSLVVASDIKVRIFENTGVVTCLLTAQGNVGNRPFSRQSRVTHVFISGMRGWKLIASQETRLPG